MLLHLYGLCSYCAPQGLPLRFGVTLECQPVTLLFSPFKPVTGGKRNPMETRHFFSANLLLPATLCWLARGALTVIGGGLHVVCACELLRHFKWASPFTLAGISTITFNCSCPRKLLLLFTLRRQHVFPHCSSGDDEYEGQCGLFFFSYFKYILLYCKIQNNNKAILFTNVQNLRLYYIFWL